LNIASACSDLLRASFAGLKISPTDYWLMLKIVRMLRALVAM
jgi:hypothetical protein